MNSIDEIFSKSKRDNQFKGYAKTEEMGEKISLAKINASSVLIPILFFEVLVCILGAKFYISIGYGVYSAAILAISIETFYMYFSSKLTKKALIIKTILLLISVTTLSYSAYSKDANVIKNNKRIESSIKESSDRLVEIGNELIYIRKEKEQIEKDMELYREFKKATIGNKILEPRRIEIQTRRESLLKEREKIKTEIENKTQNLVQQSIFTNLNILTIQTIISILAFTVVQIAICIALPDVLDTLKK